ncbi:hypothetical protein [Streptosporangium sp. NPDC000396]|uniref:hypothetical protein n=1 Tax=Streptosporangium sp. NPDC000396 TaxID=3366185 RepID=UPI0036A8EBF8
MTTTSRSPTRPERRTPLPVTISAWAIPVMVVGQFALPSAVPVAIALIGGFRRAHLRHPPSPPAAPSGAVTPPPRSAPLPLTRVTGRTRLAETGTAAAKTVLNR